jgi:hypothetical protein
MKRILKSDLDKFYTKKELAKIIISKIEVEEFDLILDPSCGDGSFYSNINHQNKIGIDILPHIEGVIQNDFLTWNSQNLSGKILSITNPPFGKQGSLALKFIKKCAIFSDTIAFILPLSFAKPSMKNKIPEYFHLEFEEILPDDSYLLNGESYDVKCVFQIWKRKNIKREKIKSEIESNFKYTKTKSEADLAIRRVGVYAGRAFKDAQNKSEQSHYFIILEDKEKINDVIHNLDSMKWNDLTVGPRSISKSELNKAMNEIL